MNAWPTNAQEDFSFENEFKCRKEMKKMDMRVVPRDVTF